MVMHGNEQCYTCVYGENGVGDGFTCHHPLAVNTDKYNCEFYDPISDDYVADIEKLFDAEQMYE